MVIIVNILEYKKYIEDNYEENYIIINKNKIPKLTDKDGINWYPLTYLFDKGLYRKYKAKDFVETIVERYMQVIWYKFERSNAINRTWFINENGVKHIIRNIKTSFSNNPALDYKKELLLDEAFLVFGIKRKNRRIMYAKLDWHKLSYGDWIQYCFHSDKDLTVDTIWKWCEGCQRYFPYSTKYFGTHRSSKKNVVMHALCKECEGKPFISDDPNVNTMRKNKDTKLIPLYLEKNYYELFKWLVIADKNYNISIFNDYLYVTNLIIRIKEDEEFDSGDYYIQYFSHALNISFEKLKETIQKSNIKIGLKAPLEEDKKKSHKMLNMKQYKRMFYKNFQCVIDKTKLSCLPGHPVLGIITPKGLNVILKEKVKIPKVNCYEYYPYKTDVEQLVKTIKRQGGIK